MHEGLVVRVYSLNGAIFGMLHEDEGWKLERLLNVNIAWDLDATSVLFKCAN